MKSLQTLEYLVSHYGYLSILLGTFFEGETILIAAGVMAHLGYLKLPYIMGMAFIGSLSGDQFFFILGRIKGQPLLSKFKKIQSRMDKVHILLDRYNDLIMIGFRFVYGIRILTPIVLGMNHKVSARRFLLFNVLGAIVWSIAVSLGGYLFGEALHLIMKGVKQYELKIIMGIVIIGLLAWILNRLTGRVR
jgi:membrane protein DedA with SNARE-associated domain